MMLGGFLDQADLEALNVPIEALPLPLLGECSGVLSGLRHMPAPDILNRLGAGGQAQDLTARSAQYCTVFEACQTRRLSSVHKLVSTSDCHFGSGRCSMALSPVRGPAIVPQCCRDGGDRPAVLNAQESNVGAAQVAPISHCIAILSTQKCRICGLFKALEVLGAVLSDWIMPFPLSKCQSHQVNLYDEGNPYLAIWHVVWSITDGTHSLYPDNMSSYSAPSADPPETPEATGEVLRLMQTRDAG